MIIDCHAHLSFVSKNETWKQALKHLISDMDKNKIGKRILIADNVSNSQCADTQRLIQITKDLKNIAIIGSINPCTHSTQIIKYFDQLLQLRRIIGLKIFPGHDKIFVNDELFQPSIKLCLNYNVPLTIHTGINTDNLKCAKYNNPILIVKLAKKYPKLRIIIAHYFWPKLNYCFEKTNKVGNIYFDTSALADAEVITKCGGINKIKLILEKTIQRNPKSIIFGTDYPICNTNKHVNLIKSLKISDSSKKNIYFRNAMKLFSL